MSGDMAHAVGEVHPITTRSPGDGHGHVGEAQPAQRLGQRLGLLALAVDQPHLAHLPRQRRQVREEVVLVRVAAEAVEVQTSIHLFQSRPWNRTVGFGSSSFRPVVP